MDEIYFSRIYKQSYSSVPHYYDKIYKNEMNKKICKLKMRNFR